MIKRFRWLFLAMFAGGGILWLVLAGGRQKDESAGAQPRENKRRESSRHRTGEVEKNLASPLKTKVAELELRLEDKNKILTALAETMDPILLPPDGVPPPDEIPEEAAKKAQAAQDFEQEVIADRQLLRKLKIELAEEQMNAKPGAVSR